MRSLGERPGKGRHEILVTGAAGLIGGIVARGLADDYAVRGLDVTRDPQVTRRGDMTRLRSVEGAFRGAWAVVDLAADARLSAPWKAVRKNNIPSSLNALEAARKAGVRRLVYASSNHVVGRYEADEPYASIIAGKYDGLDPKTIPKLRVDAPIRPDSPYGVGKAFGEAAARLYAESTDLSVICLRIGTVNRADRPLEPRHFATLLTHGDLVRLVRCCLVAPDSLRFGVYYAVSGNTWRFWDLEPAREDLAYEPRDDAEAFR